MATVLPEIVITSDTAPHTQRLTPTREDRVHFLLSKHPYLLFRNANSSSGSSSPTSTTSSSSDLSAPLIDALLAAELDSPACPDATKAWIRSALGLDGNEQSMSEVDVREICVEPSPTSSTESFQSLMSAVSGLFGNVGALEVGPTSMDGRWPYIFKNGDAAFAKGGNGQWRRVVVRDGVFDDKRKCLSYTAEWINPEGFPCRGTFYPTLGEIKPDCPYIRELMEKENIQLQEEGRDIEKNDLKAML